MTVKQNETGSAICDLRMSGCLKLLFSRSSARLDAILINTGGGLTSGDRLRVRAEAQQGSAVSLTTQAAERAYRAENDTAQVRTSLSVAQGARLDWLPQELILFNGARLERQLDCDLGTSAQALIVEPIIFGRHAMGETLSDIRFRDRITIRRDNRPLVRDAIQINGDSHALLHRPAIAGGMGAMVTLVYVAPDAEARASWLADRLPDTAGASMPAPDTLVLRALAGDSLLLRRFLIPVLEALTNDGLPTSWRL